MQSRFFTDIRRDRDIFLVGVLAQIAGYLAGLDFGLGTLLHYIPIFPLLYVLYGYKRINSERSGVLWLTVAVMLLCQLLRLVTPSIALELYIFGLLLIVLINVLKNIYLFLLPAVVIMVAIVGFPLIQTIYYSFTDMTAETLSMDAPEQRKANRQAIKEMTLIVGELARLTEKQEQIVLALQAGNRARYRTLKQELADLIATAKKASIPTPQGSYRFGTYYALNLKKLFTREVPRGNDKLLAFERELLESKRGLQQKLREARIMLRGKRSKHPTRSVGFKNYLELFGFKKDDMQLAREAARKQLVTFLQGRAADLQQAEAAASARRAFNKALKDYFLKNGGQGVRLRRLLGLKPEALQLNDQRTPGAHGAYIQEVASIINQIDELRQAAYEFAVEADQIQASILSLVRRVQDNGTKQGSLPAAYAKRYRQAKERLQGLAGGKMTANKRLARFMELRYGFRPQLLSRSNIDADLKSLQQQESDLREKLQGVIKDNPREFGFWDIFFQTVIWTIVNVFLHFTIGLYLAQWLHKRPRGNTIYRALILIPWTVPTFVSAFSWRLIFDYPDGVLNRLIEALGGAAQNFMSDQWILTACIIVNVWVGVPFMMITLLGGLQTIPEEQYEAANIDGANAWQKLMHVTLPGLKPVASVAVLLGFIWTFNMFNIIYLVTLGIEMKTKNILVTYAYEAFQKHFQYAESATYGVIILSLLLVFGSVYIRMLKRGGEI